MKELLAQQDQKGRELYECFALGEISRAEYLEAKGAATKSRDAVAVQIEELKACLEDASADGQIRNHFVSYFQKYRDIEALTAEIVDDVLEKIIVYPGGRLEILWNYRDDFKKLILDLNMGECGNEQKSGMAVLQDCIS